MIFYVGKLLFKNKGRIKLFYKLIRKFISNVFLLVEV